MDPDDLGMEEQTKFFAEIYISKKGNEDGLELLNHFKNWFSDKEDGEYFKLRVNNYLKNVKLKELMELLDLKPGTVVTRLKKTFSDEDLKSCYTHAKKINMSEGLQMNILINWLGSMGCTVNQNEIGTFFPNGRKLKEILDKCPSKPKPEDEDKDTETNLEWCFRIMRDRHFDLGNITRQDIEEGNVTKIINLLWKVYDYFEVERVQPEVPKGKIGLLKWFQMKIGSYKNIKIMDFLNSFKDGLAFCAIIHLYHPDLLDYQSATKANPTQNLDLALDLAENHLGIGRFFTAREMLESSESFEPMVVRYAAKLYHALEDPRKERKAEILQTICFMCQHQAADMSSLFEHLESHAYMFHEDRKGVDDMILEQYQVKETVCGHEGCTKVFPRDVDKYNHWKINHEYGFPCIYLHCQYVARHKQDLISHHKEHYRYYKCRNCQKDIKDSIATVSHCDSLLCKK